MVIILLLQLIVIALILILIAITFCYIKKYDSTNARIINAILIIGLILFLGTQFFGLNLSYF